MKLQPKQYFWRNRGHNDKASLGLIAQDVQLVIANTVHQNNDEDKTLSVNYLELIPVLIQALQEQQEIIDEQHIAIEAQNSKNYIQDKSITTQNDTIKTLVARLDYIESKSSN